MEMDGALARFAQLSRSCKFVVTVAIAGVMVVVIVCRKSRLSS